MRLKNNLLNSAIFVAWISAAGLCHAATADLDPNGWTQYKWGMSFEQALALSHGRVGDMFGEEEFGGLGRVIFLDHISLGGRDSQVTLQFGCADVGLISVVFAVYDYNDGLDYVPLLTKRFGVADKYDPKGGAEWDFPNTSIGAGMTVANYHWTRFTPNSLRQYCRDHFRPDMGVSNF